jgi:pyruvate-formate lyase-activating enzyme
MNMDVKSDAEALRRYCRRVDIEKMSRTCRLALELGLHLEITTLVIPGVNDPDEVLKGIAKRILTKLGPDVPWHISGYYPAYLFTAPPTLVSTLERASHRERGWPGVRVCGQRSRPSAGEHILPRLRGVARRALWVQRVYQQALHWVVP